MTEQCIAFLPGPTLCTNGFPQSAACRGATCHGCGRHSDKPPACLRDDYSDLAFRIRFDEAGLPRYVAKAQPSQHNESE